MTYPAKTTFILLLLLIASISNAQQKSTAASAGPSEEVIKKRLVDLAMKTPRYAASEHQNKINEYQLKRARNTWLNLLTISANYNDQTFAKRTDQQLVYPKFFTGVNIPLGTIFSQAEAKAAREQVKMGKDNQESLALLIKREVLSKYVQYKLTGEMIVNQDRVIVDAAAALAQVEELFKNGTTTIELYNEASRRHNTEKTLRIQYQMQQDMFKLELEEMIGTSLESVLK